MIHTWLWVYLLFFVLILGPYLIVAGVTWDRHRAIARRWARRLYRHFLATYCNRLYRAPRLQVDSFDWEGIGPAIIVANHASMLDILMLMQLPPDARCWAKKWPFRIPLLGALMRLSGHLLVEDFNVLPDSADTILAGSSLYLFPEGTRSRTGELGRFRDGAFLLAVETKRPIVVVAIHGTHACFPPGQLLVNSPRLRVQPLAVLYPGTVTPACPKPHLALKRQAHAILQAALRTKNAEVRRAEQAAA